MASNVSQRKAQSMILASKVADYASWTLHVSCKPCGVPRTVPMTTLPQELTVMQALMRMRCRTCGGRVEGAALDNQVLGWRGRIVRIWGPGSFG